VRNFGNRAVLAGLFLILSGYAAQLSTADTGSADGAKVKTATPLLSAMSAQAPVVRTLAAGEVVAVAFSVDSPDGEWCELKGGGYVLCALLDRNLNARTVDWHAVPPPEPPEMAVTDVTAKEMGLTYQNRAGRFRLSDTKSIGAAFRQAFFRPLPLSAYGATAVHRYLGLDHRNGVDVAVHPDQPEGIWLRRYLIAHNMPYFAFTHAIRGKATAAHIHIGPGSARIKRPPPKRVERARHNVSF
jgi:hypothetical protein